MTIDLLLLYDSAIVRATSWIRDRVMAIDLRLIRHAAALAEHGSFSHAADALGIAQPTLSRSIKELETSVGIPLFTRHRRGAEPTDFGYLFLQRAASVSARVVDLEREVALARGLHKGGLAIGFGPYAAELLVPKVLPRFAAAYPAVRIRIQVDTLEALGRALRQGTLDLVVGEMSVLDGDNLLETIEVLSPLKAYVFVRSGHPLVGTNPSLPDVLRYPLVQVGRFPPRALTQLLDAQASSARTRLVKRIPAIECPTVPLAAGVVAESDAVMLASLGTMKGHLTSGRVAPLLREPWMVSNWALMKLRRRSISLSASAFVTGLRAAHAQCAADEETLEKMGNAPPTQQSVARNAASRGR
jgi:DNA-binding transcriptional LysR family regulator